VTKTKTTRNMTITGRGTTSVKDVKVLRGTGVGALSGVVLVAVMDLLRRGMKIGLFLPETMRDIRYTDTGSERLRLALH
jgi:hypothetical protein